VDVPTWYGMPRRSLLAATGGLSVVMALVHVGVALDTARAAPHRHPDPPVVALPDPDNTPTTLPPFADTSIGTAPDAPAVATEELIADDTSRPPPERDGTTDSASRSMRVVLRRPAGKSAARPLIVFAHGYDTEPETYGPLLDTWAAAGYMVAAPELPGSARDLPGRPIRDIADQARDLSLVLTAVLNHDPDVVDRNRIVAAGHSDGASAVATLALNSAFHDPRFNTFLVLSGAIPTQVEQGEWGTGPTDGRLIVVVGDHDDYGNAPASQTLFESSTIPGVTIRVLGGDHSRMYLDDTDLADSVRSMIVHLLDTALDRADPSVEMCSATADYPAAILTNCRDTLS
jgi:dienelactone hydrolase